MRVEVFLKKLRTFHAKMRDFPRKNWRLSTKKLKTFHKKLHALFAKIGGGLLAKNGQMERTTMAAPPIQVAARYGSKRSAGKNVEKVAEKSGARRCRKIPKSDAKKSCSASAARLHAGPGFSLSQPLPRQLTRGACALP